MARKQIDRDKLRAAIRREGNECIFHMLDVAIELIPQAKLRKLIAGYLNPAELYADAERKEELLRQSKHSRRRAWPESTIRPLRSILKTSWIPPTARSLGWPIATAFSIGA